MNISSQTNQEPRYAGAMYLIDTLLKLGQMTTASLKELSDFALDAAMKMTESPIGYLAFVNEAETVLTMYSWSQSAMAQCEIEDKPIVYPLDNTGLWGEAVRQRRPIITNDYVADNPLKRGLPQGHIPLTSHMNFPLIENSKIVLVAGVGNKPTPYDETDVQHLTLLFQGVWNIVQHQKTLADLQTSQEQFKIIVDNILDGVTLIENRQVKYVNPRVSEIYGRTAEELEKLSSLDMAAPEEKERLTKIMQEARSQGILPSAVNFTALRPNGERRYIENRYARIAPSEKLSSLSIIFTSDVTERKRAEVERERLVKILETTNDLVGLARPDKHILYLNRAGRHLCGYGETEDLTGCTLSDFQTPASAALLDNEGLPAALHHELWQGEATFVARDGREFPVSQLLMAHKNESGELDYFSIMAHDITAQRQAAIEREQWQQQIIEAQQQALKELSTPIIPLMEQIIVMPLIGSVDSLRARDLTRRLLNGINQYNARVVILDITGVPLVDSGVAMHLNKTIQAARLKGARTIITGISDAVAEAIVDLGIEWQEIETLRDLQSGLISALKSLGIKLTR